MNRTPGAGLSSKAKRAMTAMVLTAVIAIAISRQVGQEDDQDGAVRDVGRLGASSSTPLAASESQPLVVGDPTRSEELT